MGQFTPRYFRQEEEVGLQAICLINQKSPALGGALDWFCVEDLSSNQAHTFKFKQNLMGAVVNLDIFGFDT